LEEVEITKEMLFWLIKRIGVESEIRGSLKERYLSLDVEGDCEGILIGKHGRTLEALEVLVNRMVNKRVMEPVRVVLDIDRYRERRAGSL
jgi:spoIIIJ-associated protein